MSSNFPGLKIEAALIRPAVLSDSEAIARVHIDSWKSTYKDILPQNYLKTLSYEQRATMWKQTLQDLKPRCHVLVVIDNNQVIGFASAGSNRELNKNFDGEIYAIYLLKEFQNRGIGRKLFESSVQCLVEDGFKSMMLWVLEENPTCRFYEYMGGKVVNSKIEVIGGQKTTELCYAWKKLYWANLSRREERSS